MMLHTKYQALGLVVSDKKSVFMFSLYISKKEGKIRNRYNQPSHLTQDTNGKVTTSQ